MRPDSHFVRFWRGGRLLGGHRGVARCGVLMTARVDSPLEEIGKVGLDITKSVFEVHAISEAGEVVARLQLKRRQVRQFFGAMRPCLIGMEA